jgi:hypothetical protein
MQEFPEDINGLCGDGCRLAGLCHSGFTLLSIACPVTEELKNHALLSQPCHLGDVETVQLQVGEILCLDIPRILFNIRQIEDKKQVVRLEVSKLQDENRCGT